MINTNTANVTGRLVGPIKEDHVVLGEVFFVGVIRVKRRSGICDDLPVTIPGRLLGALNPATLAGPITVSGQVRSYNKIIDEAGRLIVTLFAKDIRSANADGTENDIRLEGTICKPTTYRVTPFGRKICDMILAVNRGFGKSDYIPCVAWEQNAAWASRLTVGDRVIVSGRLQSRQYEKLMDSGEYAARTAYELSVFNIARAHQEEGALV